MTLKGHHKKSPRKHETARALVETFENENDDEITIKKKRRDPKWCCPYYENYCKKANEFNT